jgi:predicted TIM-barrel fold metal-dependent hydrolase
MPTPHTPPIRAIDIHGHYGTYACANPLMRSFMSADIDTVIERAERNHIAMTIVSPLDGLLPRGHADVVAANAHAFEAVGRHPQLRQWVIVDPHTPETYAQAHDMLQADHCVGIKIHPEEHVYAIAPAGNDLFEFAAKHRAIVLAHSGEANSLPEDFVAFADRFPEVTLILAHLGCRIDDDPTHQIRAARASQHRNIYVDTSSASNMLPGLLELAIRDLGDDRLLFGTDTPLYFQAMQRARIDHAEITDSAKRNILHDNAERLLHRHRR